MGIVNVKNSPSYFSMNIYLFPKMAYKCDCSRLLFCFLS